MAKYKALTGSVTKGLKHEQKNGQIDKLTHAQTDETKRLITAALTDDNKIAS